MKAMGLFGLTIPERFGGLELTMEEEVLAVFELCQASPVFRSLLGTTVGIGSQGILFDGTPEQQERYLPRLATGELIASFALTEPESGSDAASLRTTAVRDGDDYVVNGTKRFITNAPHAGIFTLMARTNPEDKAGRHLGVHRRREDAGHQFRQARQEMGQKGAHTCDVIFDNVRVPAANLIGGKEGQGFKTAMKVLDKAHPHRRGLRGRGRAHAVDGVVVCDRAQAVRQAHRRFSARAGDARRQQGRDLCGALHGRGRRAPRDAKLPVSTEASCAKLFASEMCGRVADRAVQIFGGAGYMAEYGIERFYRDVRLFRIYEGTTQIQQLVIARNMIRDAQ